MLNLRSSILFLHLQRSLIDVDPEHQRRLKLSSNPADQQQVAKEEMVLRNLRKLEVIATLAIRKQLPSGFELCMCDAVQVSCLWSFVLISVCPYYEQEIYYHNLPLFQMKSLSRFFFFFFLINYVDDI